MCQLYLKIAALLPLVFWCASSLASPSLESFLRHATAHEYIPNLFEPESPRGEASVLVFEPSVSEEARELLSSTGRRVSRDRSWPENDNVPVPGIMLVHELTLAGGVGVFRFTLGEVSAPLACGALFAFRAVWSEDFGWLSESPDVIVC